MKRSVSPAPAALRKANGPTGVCRALRRRAARLDGASSMPAFANPVRFLRLARPLTPWFGWGGALVTLAALAVGLLVAPRDYLQGESVRIMYVHVPAAWLAMTGWAGLAM